MKIYLFLLFLLPLCLASPLKPLPLPSDPLFLKQPTEEMYMFVGQFYEKTFEDISFLISSRVHERYNYADGDISYDFDGNFYRRTDTYKVSNSCKLIPTWIEFQKLAYTTPTDSNIHCYLFDQTYKIYLVKDSEVVFLLLSTSDNAAKLQQLHTVRLPSDFDASDSKLVQVRQDVYLLDSKNMYRIANQNTDQRQIITLYKVSGYQEVDELIDVEYSPTGTILVLTPDSLYEYIFEASTTVKEPVDIAATLPYDTNFVDVLVHNGTICILDRVQGIYTKFNGSSSFVGTEFNFSAYRKMYAYGNTLLVISDYRKIRFIAEFFFLKEGGVTFNRFYDDIPLYNDIDFFEDKAIFIGDDELVIMAHSVHRQHLMNIYQQFFDTFMAYGVVDFEMIKQESSKKALLLGISYNTIVVLRLEQNSPKLRCDFSHVDSGRKTLLLEFNTSVCGTYNWASFQEQFGNSHCRIRKAIKVELKYPFEARTSNMFMIILPFLTIIGIMVVVGAAIRWKVNMNETFRRLRVLLQKKDKGSSVNAINRL